MKDSIRINCVCGQAYDSPIGPGMISMGTISQQYKRHTCPHCRHEWDLRPEAVNRITLPGKKKKLR